MINKFSRREFNRVRFNEPIKSSIKLVTASFKNNIEALAEHTIYVIDMSAGGLRFVSKFEFMVNFLSMYKIKININSQDIILYGKIIRKSILTNNLFDYGVQFNFSYQEQT